MKFEQKIEKIKECVSIRDVVEIYGVQHDRFRRKYHCPFHGDDKNPSASISKGFFHCFACGKSWDIFSFVQEFEKCSLGTAIKFIDDKFHCGCNEPLSRQEYRRLKQQQEDREKQKKAKELLIDFENKTLDKIQQKIKTWNDRVCHNENIMKGTQDPVPSDIKTFIQSLKALDWYEWLFEMIMDTSPPETEWTFIYGDSKRKILNLIYRGKIKL